MSHRAYSFDEAAYRRELSALLESGEREGLEAFVRARFPDEPLPGNLAEKALTALYDPASDIGLGSAWRAASDALNAAYPEGIAFLTGASLPVSGWYAQSAATVEKHLPLVEDAAHRDALNHELLMKVAAMLRAALGHGLLARL